MLTTGPAGPFDRPVAGTLPRGPAFYTVPQDGQGSRLAPRGAPQRARPLDGVLPRLWGGAPLVRGLRVRGAGDVLVRRPDPAPVPRVRGAVLVDVRGRLRGVRVAASGARAARHADPPGARRPLMGPFDYDRYRVDQLL